MANEASAMKTAYHIETGPHNMYEIDAHNAVGHHPAEWSFTPWELEDTNTYRKKRYEREAARARATGHDLPEPPDDLTFTKRQQADLDDEAKARAEAADLVAEAEAEEAERRERDQKVAAARALLSTPLIPPRPQLAGITPQDPRARDAVEIPADWESLSGPKQRALAMRLNAPNTVTVEDAKARIAREAKRRKDGDPKPLPSNPVDLHPSEKAAQEAADKERQDGPGYSLPPDLNNPAAPAAGKTAANPHKAT